MRLKIVGCGKKKKKNRERTKTNNCALASRTSSSDHVPSPRQPITVYILPFTKDLKEKILSFHIQLHFIFGVQLEITSSLSFRSGILERQKDVSARERRHPRSVFPLAPRLLARSSRFACDGRVACSSIVLFSNKNAKRAQKANKQTYKERSKQKAK